MKKTWLRYMLAVGVVCCGATHSWAYNNFYIGNSLTDCIKYHAFQDMVTAAGHSQKWARCIILGSPLLYHWQEEQTNPNAGCIHTGNLGFDAGKASQALKNYSWDILTCQPTIWSPDQEAQGLVNFANVARSRNPQIQVYQYGVWAENRGNSYEYHWAEGVDKCWSLQYQQAVYRRVGELWQGVKPVLFIPIGHVFLEIDRRIRAGRFSSLNSIWSCYTDACHLNDYGSYIVAVTCYAVIYKRSPVGLTNTGWNITAAFAREVQEIDWEVVTSLAALTGVNATQCNPNSPWHVARAQPQALSQMPFVTVSGRTVSMPAILASLAIAGGRVWLFSVPSPAVATSSSERQ